jgi:hypothetical protein
MWDARRSEGTSSWIAFELFLSRSESLDVHDGLPVSSTQNDTLVVTEADSPNGIAWFGQLSNEGSSLEVYVVGNRRQCHTRIQARKRKRTPELGSAVITTSDDEAIIELEASDGVVVRAQPMQSLVVCEGVDNDTAVGAAGDEDVGDWIKLELTDQRRVPLKQGQEFAACGRSE